MKYTAEELYNWCIDNNYEDRVVEALYFNSKGFVVRPLKGQLLKKENQYYYCASIKEDFKVEEAIGDGSDQQNAVLDKVRLHPEVMSVSIVAYEKKYRIRFAFADTEEERKKSLNKKLILDLFKTLEIDTTGKVKALVKDSQGVKATRQALGYIGQGLKKQRDEK